jgi:uncharacterized damage-inducible protein DinB
MTSDERPEPPLQGDERATLAGFLDYHRATLAWKCSGLTDDQLRERPSPPSTLSLLGLVRHLADVERGWFRRTFAREDAPPLYYSDDDRDGEFDNVEKADVAEAFAAWERECVFAREAVAAAPNLDAVGHGKDRAYSLRWILVHMIEEYARHNGHADLIRERLDGSVGE